MEDTNTIKISTNYGKSVKYLFPIMFALATLNLGFTAYWYAVADMKVIILILAILFFLVFGRHLIDDKLNYVSFENDQFIFHKTTAFKQMKNEILYADILSIALQEKKIVVGLKNSSKFEIDMKNYSYKTTTQIKSEFATLEKKLSAKN